MSDKIINQWVNEVFLEEHYKWPLLYLCQRNLTRSVDFVRWLETYKNGQYLYRITDTGADKSANVDRKKFILIQEGYYHHSRPGKPYLYIHKRNAITLVNHYIEYERKTILSKYHKKIDFIKEVFARLCGTFKMVADKNTVVVAQQISEQLGYLKINLSYHHIRVIH